MNAMLLCAGLGQRFQPHTQKLAKPTLPFLNVPLMGYGLFYLELLGLKNLAINTHHLPQGIQSVTECLVHNQPYKVSFSHEPKILGSGGGIKKAEEILRAGGGREATASEHFIVANGDEIILFAHDNGYAPLIEAHKKSGAIATLLTTAHPEAGRKLGGVWADSRGQVTRLGGAGDDKHPYQNAQHFTGVFVFSQKIFSYMPNASTGAFHIFKDCLDKALAAGEGVMTYHDRELLWLDMSSEQDYISSTAMALRVLKKELASAVTLNKILARFDNSVEQVGEAQWLAPGAKFNGLLDIDSYLFMGKDSFVGEGVEVHGFGVLGANSQFIQGYIESSAIAPNVHINEMVSLRKQLVLG